MFDHPAIRILFRYGNVASLVAVILLGIVLTWDGGRVVFLDQANLTNILRQVSIIGILAVGMTLVILTGGIDLSVGSILAFSCTMFAYVVTGLTNRSPEGVPSDWSAAAAVPIAIAVAVAGCSLMGAVNGYLVAFGRIQPFIVTLAMMLSARGAAKITSVAVIQFYDSPEPVRGFVNLMGNKWFMIPHFLVIAGIFSFIVLKTRFGRHTIAVGANETAAHLSGVRVARVKLWVYALSGFLCGVAGVIQCGRSNQGDPNVGKGYELDAIAAVVVGGTNLMGGKGSVLGTVIGALTIQIISNIMDLRHIEDEYQLVLKGVIIIVAVWVQRRK